MSNKENNNDDDDNNEKKDDQVTNANKQKKTDDRPFELDEHTKEVFEKHQYKIEARLSQGSFGVVFKGVKVTTGALVAIKVIFLDKVTGRIKSHFLPRELAALMQVDHPNIVKIYDIMTNGGKVFIFMGYANGGDISGYIKANKGAITEPLTAQWFTQVSNALHYVHEKMRVAHRDIKIDNMLLHNNEAMLSDFGFATESWDFEDNKAKLTSTYCGTKNYFCPQLANKGPYNPYAADCWAMGVCLFAMLNGKFPYHSKDLAAMYKEQTNVKYLKSRYIKKFPPDLIHLQNGLLTVDEDARMTMAGVLKHGWIIRKGK